MDVGGTRFGELYKSALGKAGKLGANVGGVTLGPNAVTFRYNEPVEVIKQQNTSTPKKSQRLSIPAIRHYFEIKSGRDVERKALQAELAKQQKRESDMLVVNLETAAKAREDGIVRRMARLYEDRKLEQTTENELLEKRLKTKLMKKPCISADRVAENRAHLRSEKIKQSVEDAKRQTMENKKKLLEAAAAWEQCFFTTYKQILKIINDSPYQKSLYEVMSPYIASMTSYSQFVENFETKAKKGDLGEDDLKSAETILKNLKKILNLVTAESEKIIASAIDAQKKADEEERIRNEEKQRLKIEEDERLKQERDELEQEQFLKFTDEVSLQTFADLRQLLLKTHQDLEPLVKNKQFDDYRFQLHKAATVPLNAISSVSPQHMMDKYRKLYGLLSGSRVEGCNVTANDHPLGRLFVKQLLAKLFVLHAERLGNIKARDVHAIASILVNLWVDFPDFGLLVRAHFFEKCPYLVPAFLPKLEGQTKEEYYKSMGYHVHDDKIDDKDVFLNRMDGIMRLYSLVLITAPRKPEQQTPLGLAEAWRWSSAFLNLNPRHDIAPTMLISFLKVTGHAMFHTYGKQFQKMLEYITKVYLPLLEQSTPINRQVTYHRLQIFLNDEVKGGNIAPPAGLLPPNFW